MVAPNDSLGQVLVFQGHHLISVNPALLGHALGVPPLPAFLPSSFALGGISDDSDVQTGNLCNGYFFALPYWNSGFGSDLPCSHSFALLGPNHRLVKSRINARIRRNLNWILLLCDSNNLSRLGSFVAFSDRVPVATPVRQRGCAVRPPVIRRWDGIDRISR